MFNPRVLNSFYLHKKNKFTVAEKAQLTSMDQASPRALFHMLLTLEEEYDTLERERLDCLALRESAATSRQVTRKLDDRQRELRRQLDRKAVQVDRILKVLGNCFLYTN